MRQISLGLLRRNASRVRFAVCLLLLVTILVVVILPEIDLLPTTLRLAASCLMQLSLLGMVLGWSLSQCASAQRSVCRSHTPALLSAPRIHVTCVIRC